MMKNCVSVISIMYKKDHFQRFALSAVIGFFAVLFSLTIGVTLKNNSDSRNILERSVKSDAVSISLAAEQLIDSEEFAKLLDPAFLAGGNPFNDASHGLYGQYHHTLAVLRALKNDVGATYIYALWHHQGKIYFVFDTDETNDDWDYDKENNEWIYIGENIRDEIESPTPFTLYKDATDVHYKPFETKESTASIIKDIWGDFITGAVPIFDSNGKVIGVICVDIDDAFIGDNARAAIRNLIILIVVMTVVMAAMTFIVYVLLRRIKKFQDKMFRMANYDVITGLPNRQYLFNYMQDVTSKYELANVKPAFALVFVDLDNFKKVNDGAGHDAGDELLRAIAGFLDKALYKSKSFRPPAGVLNVSARIGGDEFIQIAADVHTEEQADIIAKKLIDTFQAQSAKISPFIAQFDIGLSIGIALFPKHTKDFHVLIKYADIAMYHAKKGGKHNYRIYNYDMKPKEEK